jgi:hypothetical protein
MTNLQYEGGIGRHRTLAVRLHLRKFEPAQIVLACQLLHLKLTAKTAKSLYTSACIRRKLMATMLDRVFADMRDNQYADPFIERTKLVGSLCKDTSMSAGFSDLS